MPDSDTTPCVARKVITKEELRQLAEALDATNGNISQAADLLGWDKKRVYKAISKIDKYAIVGAKAWMRNLMELLAPLFSTQIRFFDLEEEHAAWEWVGAEQALLAGK